MNTHNTHSNEEQEKDPLDNTNDVYSDGDDYDPDGEIIYPDDEQDDDATIPGDYLDEDTDADLFDLEDYELDDYGDEDEEEVDDETDQEDNDEDTEPEQVFDKAYVEKLRRENAKYRNRANSVPDLTPLANTFANLLGDEFDTEHPDYEQAANRLTERSQRHEKALRQAQLEKEVYRHAHRAGIDPELALDSMSFRNAINNLDPNADTFGEQVLEQLQKTADRYPRQAPKQARSGGDFTAGNAVNNNDMSVEALIKRRRAKRSKRN